MSERPERPVILFGRPQTADRGKKGGGTSKINLPSHERQVSRLQPKLGMLQKVIDANKVLLQQSPTGIEPEKTLVFEVSGELKSFYTAVKNLGNDAEWIFDTSEYLLASDDFYVCKEDPHTKIISRDETKSQFKGKVYCVLANNRALEEMVSLWRSYSKNPQMRFPTGKTGLRDVFNNLIDIHFWGYKERIEETGILEAWKEDLNLEPEQSEIKCEIELFYRKSTESRQRCEEDVKALVRAAGGRILGQSVIEGINYHAILASLPRQTAQSIIDQKDVALASADQIMLFQTTGQKLVISADSISDSEVQVKIPESIEAEPIIALFDGLPQENHPYLDGIMTIDDPDNYTAQYMVSDRMHGTSMASFIAHGDLNNIKHQVTHKIYVRPIMRSRNVLNGSQEEIPDDILIVDKIYEAVRRLYEVDAGRVAPTVRVINLSIGFPGRIFYQMMSPFARLLDWLSYTYRILFVVSAGNHSGNIDIGMSFSDFSALPIEDRTAHMIQNMNHNLRFQRFLSPAESVNALTIGASFSDESTFDTNARQVLPCSDDMVSPISAFGRGLNHSIKPDIIFDGGRNTLLQNGIGNTELRWRSSLTRAPGSLSAAPYDLSGGSQKIMFSFGTSNAAAMISHEASRCFDTLSDVFHDAGEVLPYDAVALLMKAMLVHGAEWGDLYNKFGSALEFPERFADYVYRFFGYGKPNINKAVKCAKNRITLLGYGELKNGEAHLFNLPLPFDEFGRSKIYRRLTATLAYFAPITPSRQAYRSAQLWFDIKGAKEHLIGKRLNADWQAARRGSLQHEIFQNDEIVFWGTDDAIQLKVNCANVADDKFTGFVPYALMVSFEIDAAVDIDVYERVSTRVKPPVAI